MKTAYAFALRMCIAVMGVAGSASAQNALKDVQYIRDGIIHLGMAYQIGESCDSLRARRLRGLGFLNSLRTHAVELGYSDAEIDAYVNDKAERRRLEGIARRELARLGANDADAASYCAVGRAQMAANTRIGWLLR